MIGLCNLNKLSNKISLVSIFLFEQTLHIFGVAETLLSPSITDYFVDISEIGTSSQVAKHGVCTYIYIFGKVLSLNSYWLTAKILFVLC